MTDDGVRAFKAAAEAPPDRVAAPTLTEHTHEAPVRGEDVGTKRR